MTTMMRDRINSGGGAGPEPTGRFPVDRLQALSGLSWRELQTILRVSWSTLNSFRDRDFDVYQADRYAMRCGWLPMEVWPDWVQDVADEPDGEELLACA